MPRPGNRTVGLGTVWVGPTVTVTCNERLLSMQQLLVQNLGGVLQPPGFPKVHVVGTSDADRFSTHHRMSDGFLRAIRSGFRTGLQLSRGYSVREHRIGRASCRERVWSSVGPHS